MKRVLLGVSLAVLSALAVPRLGPGTREADERTVAPASKAGETAAEPRGRASGASRGASWEWLGPEGGDVAGVRPAGPEPGRWVLALRWGGLYETDSAGGAWTPASSRDRGGAEIRDFAVDPSDPRRRYVLTADALEVTADAGATWRVSALPGIDPRALCAEAGALGVVDVVGTRVSAGSRLPRMAIIRSGDGGVTWSSAYEGPRGRHAAGLSIAASASSARNIYAGGRDAEGRAFVARTIDGGRTWTGSPIGIARGAAFLAVSPVNPSFAMVVDEAGVAFASLDAGGTWSALRTGVAVRRIAFNPSNPRALIAAGPRTFAESFDGGLTWTGQAGPPAEGCSDLGFGPDGCYFAGPDGFFYRSSAATVWTSRVSGIDGRRFTALAVDSSAGTTVLWAGGTATRLSMSGDGGLTWATVEPPPGNGGCRRISVSPADPGAVYVSSGTALWRKAPGAEAWSPLAEGVVEFAVDPGDANHLLVARTDPAAPGVRLLESRDRGASWSVLAEGIAASAVTALAIDPADPASIYLSGASAPAEGPLLLRSRDGGRTFERLPPPGGAVARDLTIDRSTPAGALFAATDRGAYGSGIEGLSWRPLGTAAASIAAPTARPGAPTSAAAPLALAVDPARGRLYAATPRGIWRDARADDPPPAVTIAAPSNGDTVDGTVRVAGRAEYASDLDRVRLYVDDREVEHVHASGTSLDFAFDWDSTSVANGDHVLTAEARAADRSEGSASITVTVANETPPPRVTISHPHEGDTLDGTVRFSGRAEYASSLSNVELFVDDASIRVIEGSGSTIEFEIEWDSRSVANGNHALRAKATAADGATAETAISVAVENETAPPSVTIATPGAGDTVDDGVRVSGRAEYSSALSKVEIFVDDGLVREVPGSGPVIDFDFVWDSTASGDGAKRLKVQAVGADGRVGSKTVDVTVSNAAKPPKVTIASPSDGATVRGMVSISGRAEHKTLVVKVEIYVGSSLVSTVTGVSGTLDFNVSWDSKSVANGSHEIRAVATAWDGKTGSDSVTVTVANEIPPPAVTIETPADGAAVEGTVRISGRADYPPGLSRVVIQVDGSPVKEVTGAGARIAFDYPWDSRTVSNGAHAITIRAVGTDGVAGTKSVAVRVSNAAPLPVVAIATPSAGSTVRGSVRISGRADYAPGLSRVDVSVDSMALKSVAGPGASIAFQADWDTMTVPNGSHAITVTATAADGKTGTRSITVAVKNENAAPAVVFRSPAEGAVVSGPVRISGRVTDDARVVTAQVSVDDLLVREIPGSAAVLDFDLSWDSTGIVNGVHAITVEALDDKGVAGRGSRRIDVRNVLVALSAEKREESAWLVKRPYAVLTISMADPARLGVTTFAIVRSVDGGAFEPVGQIGAAAVAVYEDRTMPASGLCAYRVDALDGAGRRVGTSQAVIL